jgi:hypothetical protein
MRTFTKVGLDEDAALSDYTPRLCPRIRRHDGRVERPQERTGTHASPDLRHDLTRFQP